MSEHRTRPLRQDLQSKIQKAHDEGRCFTTLDKNEARRLRRATRSGKPVTGTCMS